MMLCSKRALAQEYTGIRPGQTPADVTDDLLSAMTNYGTLLWPV